MENDVAVRVNFRPTDTFQHETLSFKRRLFEECFRNLKDVYRNMTLMRSWCSLLAFPIF